MKKYDIQIDNSRDELFTDFGSAVLKDRYLLEGETQQELFKRVALAYSDNEEHAQRIYDYISKMWFMPATPILANGGTNRGLPISCFLNEMQDSLDSIAKTWNENVYLASSGGGIGTHIGNIRSINEEIVGKGHTSGVIPFIKVVDSMTLAISQGCYDDETEILTEKGFIKFADLKKYNHNLKVAQVTPNADNFEFVKYTDFIEYKTSEHLYSFKLSASDINMVVKTASVVSATMMNIVSKNGKVILSVNDPKNSTAHSLTQPLGESDMSFDVKMAIDTFKIVPGDYTVHVSYAIAKAGKVLVFFFESTTSELTYLIAADATSKV